VRDNEAALLNIGDTRKGGERKGMKHRRREIFKSGGWFCRGGVMRACEVVRGGGRRHPRSEWAEWGLWFRKAEGGSVLRGTVTISEERGVEGRVGKREEEGELITC